MSSSEDEDELYEELSEELSSTRCRAHSSFVHGGMAPGLDVAARRNVAVAITDRTSETVQASSQSGSLSRGRSSAGKREVPSP